MTKITAVDVLSPFMSRNDNLTTNVTAVNQANMLKYMLFMEAVSASNIFNAGMIIVTYGYPVILPVSFVVNIFVIAVFCFRRDEGHSCHVYMTTIAVVDNVTIINTIAGNYTYSP